MRGEPQEPSPPPATRDVLDALPRVVALLDDQGRIELWNARAEQVTGWTRAEAVGRPLRDLAQPEASNDVDALIGLHRAVPGEAWRGSIVLRSADGAPVTLVGTARAVPSPPAGRSTVVLSADDYGAIADLQRQASELADHMAMAIEAGGLGVWRWDAATDAVEWDAAMERLFGLAPGAFGGTRADWVALVHPDDRVGVLATFEKALLDCGHYQVDHRVVLVDGSTRWLHGRGMVTVDDHAGQVTGAIGCSIDITQRKQFELDVGRRAENASALADVERRDLQRMEFLTSLTDHAISCDGHRDYMELVARDAVPRLGDWCALHFLPEAGVLPEVVIAHADPERSAWARELQERYPYDPDAPSGVAEVIRTGRPEFIPDVAAMTLEELDAALESRHIGIAEARELITSLGLRSVIIAPLVTKRGVIGAIQFVTAESDRLYSDEDLALAQAAAGRVADALDLMWWSEQQQVIAATLQRALLPPALPVVPGVRLATRYWPAGSVADVGGDFYDAFELDGGELALVVGDVCGRGPQAAALTGIARHTIRAAAMHDCTPDEVIDWLNTAFLRSNRETFCTALYCTVGSAGPAGSRRLELVCGGHPPAVLVRADGETSMLGAPGSLLGMFAQIHTTPVEAELDPGDVLVLYTDGITDAPEPVALSSAELQQEVSRSSASGDVEAIADHLEAVIEGRLPLRERSDDIAVLVMSLDQGP